MRWINNWKIILVLCLTLGLSPVNPEPHIFGKVKWIAGGAHGMQLIDWWDTLLHGTPFILLFRIAMMRLIGFLKIKNSNLKTARINRQ